MDSIFTGQNPRLMVGCCPDIGERSDAYEVMHQHFGSTHEDI